MEYSEACLESTFLTADSLVPINSGPSLVNFVRSRSRSPKGQDGRAFYSLKHALFETQQPAYTCFPFQSWWLQTSITHTHTKNALYRQLAHTHQVYNHTYMNLSIFTAYLGFIPVSGAGTLVAHQNEITPPPQASGLCAGDHCGCLANPSLGCGNGFCPGL